MDVPATTGNSPPGLLPHDRIIQTRNDYNLNVMNGAVGTVTTIQPDGSLIADFDGTGVALKPGSPERQRIKLAYALTIHKAQGTEFPCAVVIAHKKHSFMHHRNLLYTAVTRAQKTAIILGDRWGIRQCARKQKSDKRRTLLSILLK